MIREGEPDVTLGYLADGGPRKLAISNFSDGACRQKLLGPCKLSLARREAVKV